jgi:hypothetical protein
VPCEPTTGDRWRPARARAAAIAGLSLTVIVAGGSAAHAQGARQVAAGRATAPPVIDGRLDAAEWTGAEPIDGFIRYEPQRGTPSPHPTRAMVLVDDGHVYIGVTATDAEPPIAQLTRRDADLLDDDAIVVILDTFQDRRSAYYFITNPLGTQADGRIAEDGRTTDASWDAPWRSAATRTDDGWSVEMASPLTSLRFRSGEGRTWGLNIGRSRRRSLEVSFWSGPLDALYRVSQAGTLTGLSLEPPPRRHQIVPHVIGQFEQGSGADGDAGLDVRFNFTPQLALYGTVRPDFATVEADQETVNLTRFEVSLREKRQFFLDGQELFNQRIRTFYSRRIADIEGGAKLLGRHGPWTIAALSTQSTPFVSGDRANYSVVRAQRDVGGRSTVAAMVANRALDGRSQGSAEIDATLFFTPTFGFTGQLIRTYGPFDRGSWAWFVRPSWDSPTSHFHVRYTHLGDRVADNANAIGLIRDDDRREADSAVSRTWWPKEGRVERIHYNSNYNIYWGQTGVLRSWQTDESLTVDWRNRWTMDLAWTEEFKRFEKDFRNRQLRTTVGYNTRAYQSVRAGYEFGRNFDADYQLITALARAKPSDATSLEYELQRLILRPDPDGGGTWIHVVRASQSFTRDLFVNVFFQTNSAIDRRNLQVVFVYRYLPPFGTLQLAYQRGTAAFGQRSDQGHTVFLKATTVF